MAGGRGEESRKQGETNGQGEFVDAILGGGQRSAHSALYLGQEASQFEAVRVTHSDRRLVRFQIAYIFRRFVAI